MKQLFFISLHLLYVFSIIENIGTHDINQFLGYDIEDKDIEEVVLFLAELKFYEYDVDTMRLRLGFKTEISIVTYELSYFGNAKILDLSDNNLTEIICNSEKFIYLEELNLKHNKFVDVPPFISSLISLKKLDLSENRISYILDPYITFQRLETLNLANNVLISLGGRFRQLSNLHELDLSNNTDIIGSGFSLYIMSWKDDSLFFDALPPNLQILKSQNIGLYRICHSVCFSNLKYLDFSRNKLLSLRGLHSDINNLEILILNENRIHNISNTLKSGKNLKQVYLDNNKIKFFILNDSMAPKLEKLSIASNDMVTCFIRKSQSCLKMINFINNNITWFLVNSPSWTNIFNVDNNSGNREPLRLKELYIYVLNQTCIKYVFDFIYLECLVISCNKPHRNWNVRELLSGLCKLNNLLSLSLINFELNLIPEQIYSLSNLKSLNLSNNNIAFIDPNISCLRNLTSLNISYNQLKAINKVIWEFQYLDKVLANGNDIEFLPKFLENMVSSPQIYLYENINLKCFGNQFQIGMFELPYYLIDKIYINPLNPNRIYSIEGLYLRTITGKIRWNLYMLKYIKEKNIPKHSLTFENIRNIFQYISQSNNNKLLYESIYEYLEKVYEVREFKSDISTVMPPGKRDILKNYIEQIIRHLYYIKEAGDVSKIENALVILLEGKDVCFDGQLEHLIEANKFLGNDSSDIKTKIYNFIAIQKYNALKDVTTSNNFSENVHILSFWRNKLKDYLGFETYDPLFTCEIKYPLLNSEDYVLYQFFKVFSVENVVNELTKHVNSNRSLFTSLSLILYNKYKNDKNMLKSFFVYEGDIEDLNLEQMKEEGVTRFLIDIDLVLEDLPSLLGV